MRERLVELVRGRRQELGWTQRQLALALGSSASRICKLEANDSSVSTDLMLRALDVMVLPLRIDRDDERDPWREPKLDDRERRALSGELLTRAIAHRLADVHDVDAGDVRHALRNLERPPLERLARMFQRARLLQQPLH